MNKIKIRKIVGKGRFIGWLEDYEGTLHNPLQCEIWIDELKEVKDE